MAVIIVVALIASIGFSAKIVEPQFLGQHDFGPINDSQFTYSISVDCDRSAIDFYVFDGNIKPIENAKTYLSYVDYSSPLLSWGLSDEKGYIELPMRGNTSFLRGLFTMLIEKKGFKTKEFQFRIPACFSDYVPVTQPTTPLPTIVKPPAPEQKPIITQKPEKIKNNTLTNSTKNSSTSFSIEKLTNITSDMNFSSILNNSILNKWNQLSLSFDRLVGCAPAIVFSTIFLFSIQKTYSF